MGLRTFLRDTFAGPGVEARAEWGTEHLIPSLWSAWMSDSGVPISEAEAYGIPAVSNVIRSPAEIIASLPFFVYTKGEVREPARNSWQWELLHERPFEGVDPFLFFYDLVLSLEATQNAFVRKVKGIGSRRNRLEGLYVIDPHRVSVKLTKAGEKVFEIINDQNKVDVLGTDQILHVRGFTPNPGAIVGTSLIELHRNALGAQRAQQKFEGDYFQRGGVPPFWFTGSANSSHAKEIIDSYKAARARGGAYDPGALWGSIDVKSIPISMADAAYVETKQLSVEDACRIWRWPKEWVESKDEGQSVDTSMRTAEFIKLYVKPRLDRIESAFKGDPDLFYGSSLFGEFLIADLERADFVTRVRGYKDARQGGWITANEIRKLENLPARPEGDELQVTPVGGAPNEPAPDQEETDDDDA
jgi:HK97 family phage portal protein